MLVLSGAASAETLPQNDTQNGTVSGGLYIDADQPVPWTDQESSVPSREFNKTYDIPNYTDIQWARVYVNVYGGSATNSYGLNTTTKLDGNGDGTYETTLGQEEMNIAAGTNGTVYWLNDHCTKVYSDYLVWYDVTDYITCTNPSLYVKTEAIDGYNFDGRLKLMALVVAYNDGDTDRIHYWVNAGQDWINAASSPSTTLFNTSTVTADIANATLYNVALSSKDGGYSFNGQNLTSADPVSPVNFFEYHQWDVTSNVTPGVNSNLQYSLTTGSSFKSVLAALVVKEAANYDINVTNVAFNTGASSDHQQLFANEPNNITVTLKNNGLDAVGAFNIRLTVDGHIETIRVDGLAAGATTTVTFTGYAPTTTGEVSINIFADSDSEIPETNETNNIFNMLRTVFYNGYKGTRYTNGSDMETQKIFEGQYDLIYSTGTSKYVSTGWTNPCVVQWTPANYTIPAGATITQVRLYQSYTWNPSTQAPDFIVNFNGVNVDPIAHYSDTKGYGNYDYPSGYYVYDVTSQFNVLGNTMLVLKGNQTTPSLYGGYIVIIYEDPNTTTKKIWINEGSDLLRSTPSYCTNDTEATAYANFNNVSTGGLNTAKLIAILASAGDADKSKFYFNDQEYTGFWADYLTSPQIGFSNYDVTAALLNGSNVAGMQSYYNNGDGDNMFAMSNILITSYDTPVASFTANATDVPASSSIQFTDSSTGDISSWVWDFNNDGIPDSTDQNPVFTYDTPGIYTVKLVVTGNGGSNAMTKNSYIVVRDVTAPTVQANVKGGSYNTNKVVTLTMNEAGNIYYTLDGSTPTQTSKRYTAPITMTSSATLKFIAYDEAGNPSTVVSEKYVIDKTAPKVVSSNPKTKATKVSRTSALYIKFSKNIKASVNWSKVYVKNLKTGKKIKISKALSGSLLKIKTSLRSKNTSYAIYIPASAVRDILGNKLAKGITIRFKTK
ncbi:DUF3344 domain-containing protein [Methanobacterium alcaliphilum]|uniref:DUF3344 domain-containing protein n=1 Tax=Methanobacterium alcaliphilum TaxID=392018 RepID=UPI00200A019C